MDYYKLISIADYIIIDWREELKWEPGPAEWRIEPVTVSWNFTPQSLTKDFSHLFTYLYQSDDK